MKRWAAAIAVIGAFSVSARLVVAAESAQVVAHVFPGADSRSAVKSKSYAVTLSVGQRAVVGPVVKGERIVLSSGFQAMLEGWGSGATSTVRPEKRLSAAAKRKLIAKILQEHKQLYTYAGSLNYEDAKALVTSRKAATAEMIDQLASLGPGGAAVLAEMYGGVATTREKEMFIKALGKIDDPEAPKMLAQMLGGNDGFSMQREMIAALGHRSEGEVASILSGLLNNTDARIGMAAAQGLSGRPGAVGALTDVVQSNTARSDLRIEAVRSLGLVGNDAARNTLSEVALGPTDATVRQSAIQELGRTFGTEALPVFDQLLADPNERIRQNTVKAISRVNSSEAQALLKRVAEKDASPAVRETAKAYLALGTPSPPTAPPPVPPSP